MVYYLLPPPPLLPSPLETKMCPIRQWRILTEREEADVTKMCEFPSRLKGGPIPELASDLMSWRDIEHFKQDSRESLELGNFPGLQPIENDQDACSATLSSPSWQADQSVGICVTRHAVTTEETSYPHQFTFSLRDVS